MGNGFRRVGDNENPVAGRPSVVCPDDSKNFRAEFNTTGRPAEHNAARPDVSAAVAVKCRKATYTEKNFVKLED